MQTAWWQLVLGLEGKGVTSGCLRGGVRAHGAPADLARAEAGLGGGQEVMTAIGHW